MTGLKAVVRGPLSPRDPAGFVVERDGTVYRHVTPAGWPSYRRLMDSGLYHDLRTRGLLIAHDELPSPPGGDAAVLKPILIPFVSYPCEWTFEQLKSAARLTLEIQRRALRYGMQLKDASAFNVQFIGASPIFIDTLSFETRTPDSPWPAYRQACEHFLAPLALMAYVDPTVSKLQLANSDGIPLKLASRQLPMRTRFRLGLGLHLHAHARATRWRPNGDEREMRVRAQNLEALTDHLTETVAGLHRKPRSTTWSTYYEACSYPAEALDAKRNFVAAACRDVDARTVLDLGANTGVFSQIAAESGAYVIAIDGDYDAVAAAVHENRSERILPLWMDLLNPTPAVGWGNAERKSFEQRGSADLVLCLALIHHLSLVGGVPLSVILAQLARYAPYAIVEFISPSDEMVSRMLKRGIALAEPYDAATFERAVEQRFMIDETLRLPNTERTLFRLRRRPS